MWSWKCRITKWCWKLSIGSCLTNVWRLFILRFFLVRETKKGDASFTPAASILQCHVQTYEIVCLGTINVILENLRKRLVAASSTPTTPKIRHYHIEAIGIWVSLTARIINWVEQDWHKYHLFLKQCKIWPTMNEAIKTKYGRFVATLS